MRIPFFKGKAQHEAIDIDEQLFLHAYRLRDYQAWRKLREENRSFLQPVEPQWTPHELTLGGYYERLKHYELQARTGSGYCWLIRARRFPRMVDATAKSEPSANLSSPGENVLLGGISVTAIRRGAAQSGIIGYWLGKQYTGQGVMKRVLAGVKDHCFNQLKLERLEASCLEENIASRKVLMACGFVEEGVARGLLSINGKRRDHHIYSLLRTDRKDG